MIRIDRTTAPLCNDTLICVLKIKLYAITCLLHWFFMLNKKSVQNRIFEDLGFVYGTEI